MRVRVRVRVRRVRVTVRGWVRVEVRVMLSIPSMLKVGSSW
jgi:hypothetical protein